MNFIFLLMGKTNSYKNYIFEHCHYNPKLICTDKFHLDSCGVNIVKGNMEDYADLFKKHEHLVKPVYIDTPDYQVLKSGIEASAKSNRLKAMCETFLAESKEYSKEALVGIDAFIIKEDNAVDATFEFIKHLKEWIER